MLPSPTVCPLQTDHDLAAVRAELERVAQQIGENLGQGFPLLWLQLGMLRQSLLLARAAFGAITRQATDTVRDRKRSARRAAALSLLERRGVIERGPDPRLADDGFAEREPELAALATAAVTGNPPAGPEHRQRPPIALPEHGERSVSGLSAREDGFSVHAATTAPAGDARARETLRAPSGIVKRVKYVLCPPLAQDRVRRLGSGLVRILLKRAFSDGTTAIDLDPLSLLCRLAASVPRVAHDGSHAIATELAACSAREQINFLEREFRAEFRRTCAAGCASGYGVDVVCCQGKCDASRVLPHELVTRSGNSLPAMSSPAACFRSTSPICSSAAQSPASGSPIEKPRSISAVTLFQNSGVVAPPIPEPACTAERPSSNET
ncbi:MAG: hypothetical protein AMXMBFR56_16480 [Polyangiaceae bacterium]